MLIVMRGRLCFSQHIVMKFGLPVIFLLSVLSYTPQVSGQSKQEDSILYQTALSRTLAVYYAQLGDQSRLYNGSLYQPYPYTFREGSPYFLSYKATMVGSVEYDSMLFINVPLIYEDYRQILVAVDQGFRLQLINDRVNSFNIANHHFVRVFPDIQYKGLPENGFYEQLYSGHSAVLKWTKKNMQEVLSSTDGSVWYVRESNNYFIHTGGYWIYIKSRKDLLNILGDRRKEVQRFMKKNKLNYKKDRDNTLIQVAGYYDQIAN
jgi:hypothetical protein